MSDHVTTVAKCSVGMFSTIGGVVTSLLPEIEAWLRVTSLLVGITVGIATIISIRKKK
jgi:hypothetical protein